MNNKTDKNKALVIGGYSSGLKTIIDLLMKEQHPIIFGRSTPIQEKIITDTSPKLNVIGDSGRGRITLAEIINLGFHNQKTITSGIPVTSPKDISGEWLQIDIEDNNGIASPSQIAKLNASGFRVMAEEVSSFTKDDLDLLLDSLPVKKSPLFCNTCGCAKYINNCNCINKE